jgi:hypothetical protein
MDREHLPVDRERLSMNREHLPVDIERLSMDRESLSIVQRDKLDIVEEIGDLFDAPHGIDPDSRLQLRRKLGRWNRQRIQNALPQSV